MNTEPIVIGIEANPADFLADAKKIQNEMDILAHRLEKAGVSQSAYNKAVANAKAAHKENTISITDLRSAYMMVADVARVVGQAWDETAGEAVKYAEEVKNLSRSLGVSAEETSALIQVADDVRISYDSLKIAMKEAQKDGITPNIEGLANLSDKYLALQPGVERTKFLLDTFGKSGLEMGKLMEKGGDGIRSMSDAINENLIVTDDAIRASDKYQENIDNLNDSMTGLKISIGNDLIPIANELFDKHEREAEAVKRLGFEYKWYLDASETAAYRAEIEKIRLEEVSAARWEGIASLYETTKAKEEDIGASEDLTKANQDYLNTIGDVTKQLDDYNDKQSDLKDTQADLLAEKQKLIDEGWWAESEKIQDINEKLADNEQAQQDNAAAMAEATHRRILAMLEEQLSVDGLSEKESTFLLEQGVKWGIYSDTAVEAMANIQRQVDAMERNIDININVRTNYSQAGQAALEQQYQYGSGRADGGSVEPGKIYPVLERGVPELLSYNGLQMLMMPNGGGSGFVTPLDGASSGKAGGSIVINIMLDSGTPDPERVAYNLKPAVERVIRDMQRAGTV